MPRKRAEDFVKNLKSARDIESYFAVSEKSLKLATSGDKYIAFKLSDRTGMITVTCGFGDRIDEINDAISVGQIVKVKGIVQEYKGKYNILINLSEGGNVEPCPETEYELSDFTRVSKKDRDTLMKEILETISDLKNPYLKKILNAFFGDASFKEEFYECPSAQKIHHSYIGGLLEHTAGVLTICKSVCKVYPELDRDLLLAGAILHDIGKLKSYKYDQLTIELTEDVKVLGHLVLSENMIRDKIKELGDIPEDLRIRLLHVVLSHHGKTEKGWGSPVSPQIPEAFALHHADNLDAKVKKSVEKASPHAEEVDCLALFHL